MTNTLEDRFVGRIMRKVNSSLNLAMILTCGVHLRLVEDILEEYWKVHISLRETEPWIIINYHCFLRKDWREWFRQLSLGKRIKLANSGNSEVLVSKINRLSFFYIIEFIYLCHGFNILHPSCSQGLPKVYPRCSQVQKAAITLGRHWVLLG